MKTRILYFFSMEKNEQCAYIKLFIKLYFIFCILYFKKLPDHYFHFQANSADEKLAKQMLLPLAERMTEKFITDNRIEAEAGKFSLHSILV